jgi:hypothetical protein
VNEAQEHYYHLLRKLLAESHELGEVRDMMNDLFGESDEPLAERVRQFIAQSGLSAMKFLETQQEMKRSLEAKDAEIRSLKEQLTAANCGPLVGFQQGIHQFPGEIGG